MAERVVIKAAARTVVGKKVATLRRNGRLPGNVYGSGIESRAVDIDARVLRARQLPAGLKSASLGKVVESGDSERVLHHVTALPALQQGLRPRLVLDHSLSKALGAVEITLDAKLVQA